MPIDYDALKTEITTDPEGLGYAARVAVGDDDGIAGLLNAVNPAITVTLPSVDKSTFLLKLAAPAALALAGKDAATQAKWGRVLAIITGAPGGINTADAGVQAMLALAVADGILSQPQIDAATRRSGSRAEVLFGAGTVLRHQDVAIALRSTP